MVEVLQMIKDRFRPVDTEEIAAREAGGRYTACDILAPEDVPAFDRSTVDGYAVRAAETFGAQETLPVMLELAGEVQIGEMAQPLNPGECVYVPTGGMLPAGADAVVMIEQTEVIGAVVHIFRQVTPGENRIERGEDTSKGRVIIKRGREIRGAELGLLASLGISNIKVFRRPRVGIISTGNEVVPPETKCLAPGQIRDSNQTALAYLAARAGADVIEGEILPDSYGVFLEKIQAMLSRVDMLVLSGGSSVGVHDYTARVLRELAGGPLLVEGIAVQPGKPTIIADCKGQPVLGLPGHPVSALNIFSFFGTALIKHLSGAVGEGWRAYVTARLTRNVPSRPGVTEMVRVVLERTPEGVAATPVFGRSGLLRTLTEADGMILLAEETEGLTAGEEVQVYLRE